MSIPNSEKKAVQALNFFATKFNGKINRMQAMKLIWLADRAHLRKYGRTILSDTYYAVKLGPIPSLAKDISEENGLISEELRKYTDSFIKADGEYDYISVNSPNLNVFSETDIKVMDSILKTFGGFNQFLLSDISHKFPEWKRFEVFLEANPTTRKKMNYADFFTDTPESRIYFNETEELLGLSEELFSERCGI